MLFGQLIHHNLVSSISLGIALRYVLEALRTGPGNKMFRFATTALRQFHVDLAQWSQYTTHLSQVPGLKEAEPELFKSIEAAVAKAASTAAAAAESVAKEGAAANGVPPRVPGAGEVTPQKQLPVPRQDGNAAGFPTSMPSTPSNPNMLFSTINAETLEASAQNVSFPVPDNKASAGGWWGTEGAAVLLLAQLDAGTGAAAAVSTWGEHLTLFNYWFVALHRRAGH